MYHPGKLHPTQAAWLLLAALSFTAPVWAAPADDQYALSAGHYNASRWREAVGEFRAFLEQFPDDARSVDATFFLGEALVQLDRHAEAGPCFSEVLRRQPDHRHARQALFRAGESAWLCGRRDDAQRDLERFVERYASDALGAYAVPYLGEIALASGDFAAAQEYYAAALSAFPQGPLVDDCRFGMARSLEQAGQAGNAERFYRVLAGTRSELADDAQLRLGLLAHRQRQDAAAEELLSAFENENSGFAGSELRTHALYWLGIVRIARGRAEAAVAALDLAVRSDRQNSLVPAIAYTAAEALRNVDSAEAAARYQRLYETHAEHELADDALLAHLELVASFDAADAASVGAQADVPSDDAAAEGQRRAAAFRRVLETFTSRYSSSPLLPRARQTEGRRYLAREEYGQAAEVFEKLTASGAAVAAAETNPDTARRLGDPVPISVDPPPGPITHTAKDPAALAAENWYLLALARLGQNRHEDAVQALDHIDEQAPPALRDGASVARATALVALRRYEQALPELRDYLQSQPEGPDAARCWAHLAVSLAEVGRLDDAAEAYDELTRRRDAGELALPTALYVAESAYRARQLELARRMFTLLAREGNPAEFVDKGTSGLAWIDFERNPQASAEQFQQLILEHPGSSRAAEAALMRGRALEKLDKPAAAVEMYKLVIEHHADSPLLADALLGAARLLDDQELNDEAAALLERYVREFPKAAQLDAALYLWAWTLEDLDRADAADERFTRIADEFPGSTYWGDAVYRLAERAARKQDYARAGELTERLITARVETEVASHALYLKGQIAAAQEHWKDVAPPLLTLLEQYPNTTLRIPAEYWIAESAYRQGEFDRAGRLFSELLTKTHDRGEAWLGAVPLRLAQVFAQQRDWDRAYELAVGIVQQYPDFRQQHEVDYLLGRCLQSRSEFDFDAARAAYQRVVESQDGGRTETAAMAQWMIGETYFLQKNYEQALRAYYRVEQLFDYPRWQGLALLQAGKCYESQGQLERAIETYEQLIERYATTTAADEAVRRLQVARERHALLPAAEKK
jgi:TolA-binding protein